VVLMGALAGLVLGMASVRSIEALLYGVKATDLAMLGLPAITTWRRRSWRRCRP